ncbi:MAG: hypothetical protein AAFR96_01800 [Planctomycetota bacterium]
MQAGARHPHPNRPVATGTPQQISPADLGRLVDAGRHWDALQHAPAFSQRPEPDAWLAEARAWIALGIARLAADALTRLTAGFPAARARDDVQRLISDAAALPDATIPASTLAERARFAAEALAARGIDLKDDLPEWLDTLSARTTLLARDGNILRLSPAGSIELSGDHRSSAARLVQQSADALRASAGPITVEGVDPPWLALALLDATTADDRGGPAYSPRIRIIQADPLELLDGLSLIDNPNQMRRLIESPRVRWYVGQDAPGSLQRDIASSPGIRHDGPIVRPPSLRTPTRPTVEAAVRTSLGRHAIAHASDLDLIRERETFSRAGDPSPVIRIRRVALIAGRFTTVLRPMIDDLARSLSDLGCDTRIISEPDDHTRLTPAAYSRAFAELDPDLIICANHTRDDMDRLLGERAMPRTVPWVTWIQDSLPHLLTRDAGAAIGPLDLAMGLVTPQMIDELGYPRDRTLAASMPASPAKFDTSAADPALLKGLACDVGIMTNHAETPEAMCARLVDEVSSSPRSIAIVERIASEATRLADEPPQTVVVTAACESIVRGIVPDADPETRANLTSNVAVRICDRIYRHRAVHLARAICERRSVRFAIFGQGWDAHPTLAPHERGPLPHGPELAAAYAAAGLTLNITALGSFHQRIAECAVAGGLPGVLLTRANCDPARAALARDLATNHADEGFDIAGRPEHIGFATYRNETARRLGTLNGIVSGRETPYVAPMREQPAPAANEPFGVHDAIDLLSLGFTLDEPSLDALIARSLDQRWRDAQAARTREAVAARCTHAALANQLLAHYAKRASFDTHTTAA